MEPVWITAVVVEWFVIMWLGYRLRDAIADSAISAAAYERATYSWAAEVARLNGGSRIVSTPVSGPVADTYSTPQPYTYTGGVVDESVPND